MLALNCRERRVICLGKQDEQKEDLDHMRTQSHENTSALEARAAFTWFKAE